MKKVSINIARKLKGICKNTDPQDQVFITVQKASEGTEGPPKGALYEGWTRILSANIRS